MDEENLMKKEYFSEFVESKKVRTKWKDKIMEIATDFSNQILKKELSWAKFSQSFAINCCEEGKIEDSFFLKGALIEEGIVNCELAKLNPNPNVIIVKKCTADDTEINAQQATLIIDTLSKLEISVVICLETIPSILVAKFVLNNITAIQNVPMEQVQLIKAFSGLPILESFSSTYSSLPRTFYGFFYVSMYGFEPDDVSNVIITDEIRTMIKNGYKTKKSMPVAFFVHNNISTIGSFILYGCQEEEEEKVSEILTKLLDVNFNDYCAQHFNRVMSISHYVENPFTSDFPFSLIHFSSQGFSVCTPYINGSYTKNDLSLRFFFTQACTGTPETEPIFDYVVEESVFELERNIAFRLLHDSCALTFSTFPGRLLESSNPPALFWEGAYQPVVTDQFFEMSFTAFARFLFNCNDLPCFGITYNGIGLLVEKNTENNVYKLADPINPPKRKPGTIPRSLSSDDPSVIDFFSNIMYAIEVVFLPSLSMCDQTKAGPYFYKIKRFITEFGGKVASHSDWECQLRYQLFVEIFQWFSAIEQMSPQLKNIKIPSQYMQYCTSPCRTIIIKLLIFSDFPQLEEVFEDIDTFNEKDYSGVPKEWMLDLISGKSPQKVTNEQHLHSVKTLIFASSYNYFYPQIMILHSVNINSSEPATIIAFALASDKFVAHALNYCPCESSQPIFNGTLSIQELKEIVSLPELSQPFTLELEEKYPVPWQSPSPKISVEIQFPLEFLALMSFYGYSLEDVVRILKTGHATETAGGKSDAKYFETSDHRFLIKTISQVEMSAMPSFLPNYFKYVSENIHTKITRVICVFTISVEGVYHYRCVLMENLRYGFKGNDVILYDFKGAKRNRHIDSNECSVQLDTNYEKSSLNDRLILGFTDKQNTISEIDKDAHFLASNNIMDYSLIVVLSRKSMKARMGIVDIFRTYTFDKALETWMKKATNSTEDPTVISPNDYCDRFVHALDKYFYMSPSDKDAEKMKDIYQ